MAGPGICHWDIKVLNDLAYISGLRGKDGTGILQAKTHNYFGKKWATTVVAKSAHDVNYFQWYNASHPEGDRRLFSGTENNLFAVHTRAATRGALNEANAHPFEFEKIIGMHNGTLKTHKYQDKDKTDSELLIKDIDENGIIPVLSDLHDFDNHYALVLFNKEDNTVSFVRNPHRHLYFCFHATRDVMYWASEELMLRLALGRNDEKIFENKVISFQPHRVHTIPPSHIKGGTFKNWTGLDEFKPKTYVTVHTNTKGGKGNTPNVPFDNQDMEAWGDLPWTIPYVAKQNANENSKPEEEEKKSEKPRIKVPLSNMKHQHQSKKDQPYIPRFYCTVCIKPMKLIDQFYGTKISDVGYICEDCVLVPNSLPKAQDIIVN